MGLKHILNDVFKRKILFILFVLKNCTRRFANYIDGFFS